jgi:hypothetical protein
MSDHLLFYEQQNIVLKSITVFCGIFITVFINERFLILLLAGILLFFGFSISVYKKWFSTILKMTFFWISYFLAGIIFNISFFQQIIMFFRINLMLAFSIFFVITSPVWRLSSSKKKRFVFFSKFTTYLTITFYLIPLFLEQFSLEFRAGKSPLLILENAFKICHEKAAGFQYNPAIEPVSASSFYSLSNAILLLFLLFLMLLSGL